MPTALQGGSLANASDNDGAKHYQNSAALPYFYAPHHHFAFLISNFSSKQSFQAESKDGTPKGLTLNPFKPI
ncbi:MAG: hypothetical protein KHZ23_05015 [Dialister sp.]|uniref:hypothetical protein n=1 Tax=Dialister sp. TaxID=1955814 RepID=UPI00402976CF|nr:hypothetical protein [Dialister sp.]